VYHFVPSSESLHCVVNSSVKQVSLFDAPLLSLTIAARLLLWVDHLSQSHKHRNHGYHHTVAAFSLTVQPFATYSGQVLLPAHYSNNSSTFWQ
jgi:hypothetical protein